MKQSPGPEAPNPTWQPYLHLWITSTLVLVHPLLDVLARHPEFFLVQDLDFAAVAWGTLAFLLLAPVPLALLRLPLCALGSGPSRGFDTAVFASAAVVFFLQAGHVSFLKSLGRPAIVVLAAIVAAGSVWLWTRFQEARTFYSFLAPALVVVPVIFLLNPQIRSLAQEPDRPRPIAADLVADVPIVFVVFDALSASAVMDSERRVNRFRFPNLAELADDSLWFTHATTVAYWTTEALPAILTGRYPDAERLPSLGHNPENLFTALAESHRIVASEPMFHFCPPELNQYLSPDYGEENRWRPLATDLSLVYLHRTLPPAFSRSLPAIDEGWGNFLQHASNTSPLARFSSFLDAIEPHPDPTLSFLHVLFPHMPYQHLPSGRIFRWQTEPFPTLVRPEERRVPDQETQIFLYKRYLFQTGHVDRLVGDLVRQLHATDLYDRSLVIITADHGGRTAPFHTTNDILSVPLLVKLPRQSETGSQTRRVSVLDVLPSLLDLLGTSPPWEMDGRSIFTEDYEPPNRVFARDELVPASDATWQASQAVIDWKLEQFGVGDDPLSLFRAGAPYPEILGIALDRLTIRSASAFTAELDEGSPVIEFDPDSGFVPVLVRGSLFFDSAARQRPATLPEVAISLNGVVEAVATVRLHEEPAWYRFRLTVPESAFQSGANTIQIWLVDTDTPRTLRGPL